MNRSVVFKKIDQDADRIAWSSLSLFFIFGIGIGFFYDTVLFAFSVGGLTVAGFVASKLLLPHYRFYQYYLSVAYGIFMAQFIYQMHGMFEMHFFAFVGSALLISYQNWKVQLPNLVFIVIHHSLFAWLQFTGSAVFFTQLDYMDFQTFLFHASLAAVIILICSYWSYYSENQTINNAKANDVLANQFTLLEGNILFAEEIKNGNLDSEFELKQGDDKLGKALIDMRSSLKLAKEREEADRYINIGIAKISELLRNNNNDIDKLSKEVITALTKYMQANQAGFYVVEENESHQIVLELKAHYAYNRLKYSDRTILPGEGLVGQVYLEKEHIILTELPNNYIQVTSGLGEANPNYLIIIPLKNVDEVLGVIEMASFRLFNDFEVQFLLKISEAIGSSILSAKNNHKTSKLLRESQEQREVLHSQEEEMRQNLEEMMATQEEMTRRQDESAQLQKNLELELEKLRKK